jgi:hypothetical protein
MRARIFTLLLSVLFTALSGTILAATAVISPFITLPVLFGASLIPGVDGLRAGVYKEVWTGEMVKAFKLEGSFLDKVPDQSRFVENDVIHLVKIGVKPEVLINNTTYPLTPASLADVDIPIGLDKLETVPTAITDDELYAISYPKMQAAIELHKDSLMESALKRAVHAFAPAADATLTPLIKTTGGDNGNGYNKITVADIISLKKAFDDMKVPMDGNRILVLCSQHVNDLLNTNETFQKQYQDITSGRILNMYSFEIHEFTDMPLYDDLFAKKAYGAAAAGTDRDASVAFYAKRMFKAKGSTKAFITEAEKDALNKTNYMSYNQRFIALPKTQEAIGAIVNDTTV